MEANAKSILDSYDDSKTFVQNMNANKYFRIYDSGTLIFGKKFKLHEHNAEA